MNNTPLRLRRVQLTELSRQDRDNINEVLNKARDSTVFHTLEWNETLIEEFRLRNVTLLATMGNEPVGLYSFYVNDDHRCRCPQIHLESPYGGPISTRDDAQVVETLLREGERLQRTALFQIWTAPSYDISSLVQSGYQSTEMWTSVLNLHKSEEELWSGLAREKRRMIRKAWKNDVRLVEADAALVDEYHQITASTMARAQRKVRPRSFFTRVIEELGGKGMAKFVLAEFEGKFIAGAIALPYKDRLYGWHMGSYQEYWSVAPNDFLQWELIKWARREGYKYYDLLRIQPDLLPGIARWKIAFGGDTVPCYFLEKATVGFQFMRTLRLVKNPKRIADRLQNLVRGGENVH